MAATHPDKDRLLPPPGWREPTAPDRHGALAGAGSEAVDATATAAAAAAVSADVDGRAVDSDEDDDIPAFVTRDEEEGDPGLESDSEDEAHPDGTNDGEDATRTRDDGMERGSLAFGGLQLPRMTGSVSARIAALYAAMPEADEAVPCVDPALAERPTFFDTPALELLLRFIVTCGGGGMSKPDQLMLAKVLLAMVPDQDGQMGEANLHDKLATPHSLVTAVCREEARVLADRSWMRVLLSEGDGLYNYYHRDALDCAINALRNADDVQLLGEAPPPGPDGDRRRSRTMDSDLFLEEQADVQRIHRPDAKVLGIRLHADEAVISWNGAYYVYPIRIFVVNARGGSGAWETIGLIPHIPKVVGNGKNDRSRQKVSDERNELLQRCLALVLRRLIHASEHGTRVDLSGHGSVLLVPRVVGIVVDQVQEREMMGLMGHQCTFNCTHCMVRRDESCTFRGEAALPRPVVATTEAQLAATLSRMDGGRPRVRVALANDCSALPFVHVLGAVHGLGTGSARLYDVVSFDTLHVWKLGVLRTLAQDLPAMLAAVCDGQSPLHGSVQDTLDVLNLRGFELGRLCRASPMAPGYVHSPPSVQCGLPSRSPA